MPKQNSQARFTRIPALLSISMIYIATAMSVVVVAVA